MCADADAVETLARPGANMGFRGSSICQGSFKFDTIDPTIKTVNAIGGVANRETTLKIFAEPQSSSLRLEVRTKLRTLVGR
jgi:hypothetical protein